VLGLLRTATGVDFSGYKRGTLERRVLRRTLLQNLEGLDEYAAYLAANPAEVEALYEDLLIKVTSFFRSPEKFEALQARVFPRLIQQAAPESGIRIWVPACATGEEAYSIAIALSEVLEQQGQKVPVQIFATDVSEKAIERARAGVYPAGSVHGMAPERLRRFFERRDGGYRVVKPIRELCVFAAHNVLADPPLSRIGLISCCNLLIYLQPVLQRKLIAVFHYALQPEGVLMLGDAEALSPGSPGFAALDEHHKLYTRLATPDAAQVDFSTPDLQVRADSRRRLARTSGAVLRSSDVEDAADRLLLERSTLAGVVVNANLDILKFRGATSPYLEHPTGSANLNLLQLAREELFLELRAATAKARKTGRAVRREGLHIKRDGRAHQFNLEIVPLETAAADPHYLVLFEATTPVARRRRTEPAPGRKRPLTQAEQIAQHKRELAAAARQLHALAREHDRIQETLRLAHEEALSSNEELQSLNEELKTSKEELQASNEELVTLNEELRSRGAEAAAARLFAESIIATVREPLVILDADLYVKDANPAFYQKFQVSPAATEGRRIYQLGDGQWDIPNLRRLLEELLPKQTPIVDYEAEHDFPAIGRRTMLLSAHQIDSVNMILLAIEDVTAQRELLRRREEDTRLREQFLSVASHELRSPLTVIQGHIQGLLRWIARQAATPGQAAGAEPPETLALDRVRLVSSLERAETAVHQLAALMTRLLNLKYLLETSVTPVPARATRVDLTALVAAVIEAEAAKRETAPDEPPVVVQLLERSERVWGDWDAGQLQQVLVNLLDNAVKYSNPGGAVRVAVGCEPAEDSAPAGLVAHVLVQDEGIGIPHDYLERIFELFVRAPNAPAHRPSGGGLGLAICQQIVQAHGGRLWAESAGPGQGSTFHLLLPGAARGRVEDDQGQRLATLA
jgi:two-component system CheB/CheR fusion protein